MLEFQSLKRLSYAEVSRWGIVEWLACCGVGPKTQKEITSCDIIEGYGGIRYTISFLGKRAKDVNQKQGVLSLHPREKEIRCELRNYANKLTGFVVVSQTHTEYFQRQVFVTLSKKGVHIYGKSHGIPWNYCVRTGETIPIQFGDREMIFKGSKNLILEDLSPVDGNPRIESLYASRGIPFLVNNEGIHLL